MTGEKEDDADTMNESTSFSMAAAGDLIQTRPLTPYEGTDDAFDRLVTQLRQTDVTIGNLEVLVHDYEGYPAATSGGTYMRSPPAVLDDLDQLGFDLFSAATNHTFDYSHGGITATIKNLEERNVPYAGIGETLYDARKPAYVETPAGRVALISACTSFPPGSEAGKQSPTLPGRPGLNPIHVSTVHELPPEELERLKQLSETVGIEAVKRDWFDRGLLYGHDWANDQFFHFSDMKFVATDGEPGIVYQENEADVGAFEAAIDTAEKNADWVVASIHSHQGVGGLEKTAKTPAFLERTAHRAIDAGADAVLSHGPHVLRGVELYEERPIFYSLGNFVVQNETVSKLPPESFARYDLDDDGYVADVFEQRLYDQSGDPKGDLVDDRFWTTVLPVCEFTETELSIRLYPCTLQGQKDRPQRGIPNVADGSEATEIIDHLAELSLEYGTDIETTEGCGEIRCVR